MALKTLFLQSGAYNALDDRMIGGLWLDPTADPLSGGGRIVTGLLVSAQATPNMTVLVSPGRGVCPTPASDGGGYIVMNDANSTVTVPPVSTLPRWDLLLLAVDDADYSGAIYGAKFYVLAGTPAASPSYPTQPAGTVMLAQLQHSANATSVAQAAILRNSAGAIHECEYQATTIQSITSNGDRPIAYPTAMWITPDVTKGTSTAGGVADARFQLNRDGIWAIDAGARLQVQANMSAGIWIGLDGAGMRFAASIPNTGAGAANIELGASCVRRFGAGTALNVNAWHNSATAKNTDPFNQSMHFRATWLRP
jgi:hypothetical protein